MCRCLFGRLTVVFKTGLKKDSNKCFFEEGQTICSCLVQQTWTPTEILLTSKRKYNKRTHYRKADFHFFFDYKAHLGTK